MDYYAKEERSCLRGRWLTVNKQIEHCKNKGITFTGYSEKMAKKYLSTHNTFIYYIQ